MYDSNFHGQPDLPIEPRLCFDNLIASLYSAAAAGGGEERLQEQEPTGRGLAGLKMLVSGTAPVVTDIERLGEPQPESL